MIYCFVIEKMPTPVVAVPKPIVPAITFELEEYFPDKVYTALLETYI